MQLFHQQALTKDMSEIVPAKSEAKASQFPSGGGLQYRSQNLANTSIASGRTWAKHNQYTIHTQRFSQRWFLWFWEVLNVQTIFKFKADTDV